MVDKITLGIDGFKQITVKPLPNKFWLAIVGPPGSFKSVFCITVTEQQMKSGTKVIYVTTEMTSEEVIGQAHTFGFDWDKRIADGDLIVIDTEAQRLSGNALVDATKVDEKKSKDLVEFDILSEAILRTRERWELNQSATLVIDSVASLWEDKPAMSRKFFRFIKRRTQNWFSLVLVTSQLAIGTNHAFGFGIEHGVDGILRTGEYFENGEMKNWVLCVKMRALKVNRFLFSTEVTNSGFKIGAPMQMSGRYASVYDAFSD